MSGITWDQFQAECEAERAEVDAFWDAMPDARPPQPQCLICGRFVASETFHSLGMYMNGEYTFRWTCSLCGLQVAS